MNRFLGIPLQTNQRKISLGNYDSNKSNISSLSTNQVDVSKSLEFVPNPLQKLRSKQQLISSKRNT